MAEDAGKKMFPWKEDPSLTEAQNEYLKEIHRQFTECDYDARRLLLLELKAYPERVNARFGRYRKDPSPPPVSDGVQEGDRFGVRPRFDSGTTFHQEANMILTSCELRRLATKHGLMSARGLCRASGVSLHACHKLVTGNGNFMEATLTAFTEFFRRLESQPKG